jgi:hypothetical protein
MVERFRENFIFDDCLGRWFLGRYFLARKVFLSSVWR